MFVFFHIISVFPNLETSLETVPSTHVYTDSDIILFDSQFASEHTIFPVHPFLKLTLENDVFFQLPTSLDPHPTSCCWEAMRVVKCFSLEPMALEMLSDARERELEAQWFKRKERGRFTLKMWAKGGW